MKHRSWLAPTLAVALAACSAPQQAPVPSTAPIEAPATDAVAENAARAEIGWPGDQQVYSSGSTYRLLQVEELPIVGVTVDSQVSTFPKERLTDGDLSTEWVNGGYRNATSWAAVELAESASLSSIGLKTGPTASGASYDIQVSGDGTTWSTVASNLTNSTWGLESKPLPAGTSGKFVRIFWRNSPTNPQPHFGIFELVVNGEPGVATSPSPTPTATPTPTPTSSPTATPTPTPSTPPSPTPPPSGEVVQLTPASISASSTYAGLVPGRAIDGSSSTQWANGGYRESEATLTLRFGQPVSFDRVRIKTGALPSGVRYRIETSSDGNSWTAVTGDLTNTTWQMETKNFTGTGEHLRVHLYNSPTSPMARFSVFELEAYGALALEENAAPVIDGFAQFPMKILNGGTGDLEVRVADPEGDPVTITWTATKGTVIGTGTNVSYQAATSDPGELDDTVTVVATDSHGNQATRQFEVDTYIGSEVEIQATDAVEWDPSKAAYAQLTGNVTVFAGGDFSVYNAVIAEYTTSQGRRLALLKPGETALPGVTGNVFMYLLGPTGEYVPHPSINLTLSGGGQTVNRTITSANVAADYNQGYEPSLGPGGAGHSVGRSTAKNGQFFYNALLEIQGVGAYTVPDPEHEPTGEITYTLHLPGSTLPGLDRRLCPYDCVNRLVLTDSLGGTGDNTGFWRVFSRTFDD